MLRFLCVLFAVFLSAAPAMAATTVCRSSLYPDRKLHDVTRFLDGAGKFSFETYRSASAPEFDSTLWLLSSPTTSTNDHALRFEIDDDAVRKLKKDSFVEISNGAGKRLEMFRQSPGARSFALPLSTLFKTYGESGSLTLKLMNGRAVKKESFAGKLDLGLLAKEAALIPAAQKRLDAMQADFRSKCEPLTEPDPDDDPANWSCAHRATDEYGDYFADGDSVSLLLRLSKVATISWSNNNIAGLATLYWQSGKVSRSLAVIRFQNGKEVFETVAPLPRSRYDTSFNPEWSLVKAMQLQNDMLIQALDEKGNVLEQVTLPKATMEHAAKQIRLMQANSIEDRNDYKNRCEMPIDEPIIVT
jgi:hypothetical protein